MPTIAHPSALAVLLLSSTLGVMAGAIVTPILELLRTDLGLTGTQAGLILAVHGLAIAITGPVAGMMIDRWGPRVPLAIGLVIYGLAGGAGVFLSTFPALIVSRLIFGMGAAIVFTGTTTAILTIWQGAFRNRVMGWRTTATSAGGVVFPILAGLIGSFSSWHFAFAIYLFGIPLAIAVLRILPDRIIERGGTSESTLVLLRKPALLGVYVLFLMMAVLIYAIAVFLPQRLAEIDITSPIIASLYMALMAGMMSVAGLGYARARQHLSKLALLRFSACCWVAAYALFGLTGDPVILVVATMLLGFGNGVAFATLSLMVADLVPDRLLGRGTSLSATLFFLGQFLAPIVLGPMMQATSITTGYLIVAAASALILATLCLVRPAPVAVP
ncbi:MFS transporter [Acuticoccus kandeliae]|uniref:MFS transporter n=1 Tax=Acuticoccus kandeliae TaxID=2073160 RepID=UPI000D3EB00B|nr:MFS transporter [Acuticoccus kandeliae]